MELTVEKKGTDYSCDQTITVVSRGISRKGQVFCTLCYAASIPAARREIASRLARCRRMCVGGKESVYC